jgi:hypothetical protein
MEKVDFPEHGFHILLANDPRYRSERQNLDLPDDRAEEQPQPVSVLVKNTSSQTIVAFGIRWTKRHLESGYVATSDASYFQPFGLLDGGKPRYDRPLEGVIPPGSTWLVTVEGVIQGSRGLQAVSTSYVTDLSQWAIDKVQLDSAVFDNGVTIGPDDLDVVKRLKTQVDARQDLMEQISERLSRGDRLYDVLQDLRRELPKTELRPTTDFDSRYVYTMVRQQYLDELSTTERNAGEDVAIGRLQQLMYSARPSFHAAPEGNGAPEER